MINYFCVFWFRNGWEFCWTCLGHRGIGELVELLGVRWGMGLGLPFFLYLFVFGLRWVFFFLFHFRVFNAINYYHDKQ